MNFISIKKKKLALFPALPSLDAKRPSWEFHNLLDKEVLLESEFFSFAYLPDFQCSALYLCLTLWCVGSQTQISTTLRLQTS